MTPKVFISSTALDLGEYRRAALEECVAVSLLPLDMKFFEAMTSGATEGSKQKLDEADLYLGIFAHRYGYVEDGYPASVTECEYDYATERGLDRLCFLVQDDYPVGDIQEDDAAMERLRAMALCQLQQEQERWPESLVTARQTAWAIRSDAYFERLRRRGAGETVVQQILEWLGAAETAGQG